MVMRFTRTATREVAAAGSTPPDKTIVLPLTPPAPTKKPSPAVSAVLRLFRLHQEGELDSLWTKVQLSLEEHTELWRQLEGNERLAGYVENEVRYDFDPYIQQLAIRMTTLTHDKFIAKVVQDILFQLKAVTDSLPQAAAQVVRGIEWQGTSRIILRDEPGRGETGGDPSQTPYDTKMNLKYPKHCPDAAFQHNLAKYPQVVFEVLYSQSKKDLPNIAESYIIGSKGSIRVVVGLDLEYRRKNAKGPKTKLATLSMWRPRFWEDGDGKKHLEAEQVIQQEPFRSAEGAPVLGSLDLKLLDFALPEIFCDMPESTQAKLISIPYNSLAAYLAAAEPADDRAEAGTGSMFVTTQEEVIAHKRKRTPSEEFDSADDAGVAEREVRKAGWGRRGGRGLGRGGGGYQPGPKRGSGQEVEQKRPGTPTGVS